MKLSVSANRHTFKILYNFAIVKIGMLPNIQWTLLTKTTKIRTQRQLSDWLFEEINPT